MKTKMRKLTAVLLSALLIVSAFTFAPLTVSAADNAAQSVGASSGTTGDCIWTLDDDGVLTISGNGAMEDYSSYTGPWGRNITELIIENGVTSIGKYSFGYCSQLTSVTIPPSVSHSGDNAFYNCTALNEVNISDIAAWCGIEFVSEYYSNPIFCAHNLYLNNELVTDLVIPNGVTSIGAHAFYNCKCLTSVTIPSSFSYSGSSAFNGCSSLEAVYISDIAAWCGIEFTNAESNPVYLAKNLYLNDELVTDLVIPEGITTLRLCAFVGCTCITTVSFPNTLTTISERAFYGCTGLTELTFPDSLYDIGIGAFYNCTNVKRITVPDSVKVFGTSSFGNIPTDAVVTCLADSYAEDFARGYGFQVNVIPYHIARQNDGSVEITKYTGSDEDVVIPDSFFGSPVSSLKSWAFANNSDIRSVTIPVSITEIPRGAFYNCTELTTVTMGNVTSIGNNAFEKCLYLQNIDLGNQLESIGDEAFYDCRRLKNLAIPATVTSIGEECFTNCRSLTSLAIPRGVQKLGDSESVGYGMFENCVNLTEVSVPLTVKSIQGNAFAGCRNVTVAGGLNTYAERFAADNDMDFKVVYSESVGNPNLDLKISISDVTAIQRHLAEVEEFSAEQYPLADVDGNGVVNIDDATLIQMYLAEYDVVLG